MRQNMFGEDILQPGDTYHDADLAFLDRYGEPMDLVSADIFTERDDTFLFGGVACDSAGNEIAFDGFESIEAAEAFARDELQIGMVNRTS